MFNYFEIHLVEHCNLNCRSCDNFSPLAKEAYIEIESFNLDLQRLSILAQDKIKKIRLLGGEPLLHPNICELLISARTHFPNTEILLTTNGILLNRMTEEFWLTCYEYGITIEITYYPINIKKELIDIKANHYAVKVIPFAGINTQIKVTHRNPINSVGDQNAQYNYLHCYQRGNCISLKDGKIYPCTCIPNIVHFNNYYNKQIPVMQNDYIDIYKVQSWKEIDDFLYQIPNFCRYCDVKSRTDGATWSTTKYDIKEWYNER